MKKQKEVGNTKSKVKKLLASINQARDHTSALGMYLSGGIELEFDLDWGFIFIDLDQRLLDNKRD